MENKPCPLCQRLIIFAEGESIHYCTQGRYVIGLDGVFVKEVESHREAELHLADIARTAKEGQDQ